jgi:hypothetical protein
MIDRAMLPALVLAGPQDGDRYWLKSIPST